MSVLLVVQGVISDVCDSSKILNVIPFSKIVAKERKRNNYLGHLLPSLTCFLLQRVRPPPIRPHTHLRSVIGILVQPRSVYLGREDKEKIN